jgi:hypothetical protein
MLYIHFDICNYAWLGPVSSLDGHEGPKFVLVKVFHVQLFCALAGKRCFVVINQAMKMSCR